MKSSLILAMGLLAMGAGCGGRAHLEDDVGSRFHRVVLAQRQAKPRKSVAPATAAEINVATANRMARLRGETGTGSSSSSSSNGFSAPSGNNANGPASANVNLGPPAANGEGGGMRVQGK